MRQKGLLFLVVLVLVALPGQALAKDGLYMGMDLGVAVAPGLDLASSDNDYPTVCDKFINSDSYQVGTESHQNACDPSVKREEKWTNDFGGGVGVMAGLALGYRLGDFRFEGEYLYRTTTYDEESNTGGSDSIEMKQQEEIDESIGGVDDVLSHNFFANLYYDYNTGSKFTPYVGVGVGFAQVSLDYFGRFKRNSDPKYISTFKNNADGSDCTEDTCMKLNNRLAGTTTIGRAKLSDTLFGYQVLAGVDYQVSEPVTIGIKFRWADFGEFEDGEEWDQLRSHDSTNMRGDRVRYNVRTEDIQFWGVSLNMKYQF